MVNIIIFCLVLLVLSLVITYSEYNISLFAYIHIVISNVMWDIGIYISKSAYLSSKYAVYKQAFYILNCL